MATQIIKLTEGMVDMWDFVFEVWGLMLSQKKCVLAHRRQACIVGAMQAADIQCWHWVYWGRGG